MMQEQIYGVWCETWNLGQHHGAWLRAHGRVMRFASLKEAEAECARREAQRRKLGRHTGKPFSFRYLPREIEK